MTCNECAKAHSTGRSYPYRIGNVKIGFGTILIIGCNAHCTLALDKLNEVPTKDMGTRMYHSLISENDEDLK